MRLLKPSAQPGSSLTVTGGDLSRHMVGAWFMSSPGIGGRVHNHAPWPTSMTQSAAVSHAIVNNPYVGTWRLQQDCVTFENTANQSEASGPWVDLGDPIATGDDVSVLIGWIPAATTVPSGIGPGSYFVRGQDGAGSGCVGRAGWRARSKSGSAKTTGRLVTVGGRVRTRSRPLATRRTE